MCLKPLELEGCVREGPLGDINPETPHDLGWVSDIVFALAAVKTPSAALANTRPAHRALGPDPAPSPCRHRRVRRVKVR